MLQVYRASAGSGKTFTLAYEYIKLLLGEKRQDATYRLRRNPEGAHRTILAITFTNKATEEMKRRIVHELAVLAGSEPGWDKSPYADRLTNLFGCTNDELRRAADAAMRSLLFDFHFFQVSTIDAFFQTILRTFAREAELSGAYELELENRTMLAEGINRLLNSFTDSPRDTTDERDMLTSTMLRNVSEGNSGNLLNRRGQTFDNFMGMLLKLFDEKLALDSEAMKEYVADPELFRRFRSGIAETAARLAREARTAAKRCLDLIQAHSYTDAEITKKFLEALISEAEGKPKSGVTIPNILTNGAESVFKKAYLSKNPGVPDRETSEAIMAVAEAVVRRTSMNALTDSFSKNLIAVGLMNALLRHIEEYRSETNSLLLSDTGSLLRTLIGDGDSPFVYERMGIWLNHYLIDEFQDTSALQWDILRPLLSEGLATEDDHDSLIIGDEKQCIYRFRNSDPTLLGQRVEVDFSERVDTLGGTPESNTNWRSSADVVEFNNNIFESMARSNGLSAIYANVRQCISPAHAAHRGYISVTRLNASNKSDALDETLPRLADDIARQLSAGYRPADIAILTRGGAEAREAISYLLQRQLDDPAYPRFGIISDDAMLLATTPAVKAIINELRAYAAALTDSRIDPQQQRLDNLLAEFENRMVSGEEPVAALAAAVDRCRATECDKQPGIAEVSPHTAWSLPLLVEEIAARAVPQSMHRSQHAFISAFMDLVTDFCSRNTADITSFLRWWDNNGIKQKVSAPADTGAIRVMTIHKSKGLEFPCVHLPFLNWDIVAFKSPEWVDTDGLVIPGIDPACIPPKLLVNMSAEKLTGTPFEEYYRQRVAETTLDEINTLYVAFTRAADELCAYFHIGKTTRGIEKSAPTAGRLVADAIADAYGTALADGETFTIGTPTCPREHKAAKPTAVDPVSTAEMPSFYTLDRPELWDGIILTPTDTEL